MTKKQECPYELVERMACLPFPNSGGDVTCADDLLREIVANCDSRGRYYSKAWLLVRLCWWAELSNDQVREWRDELLKRGDISIEPLGRSIYSDSVVDILVLQNPRRFERFAPRAAIPARRREAIYERDGYQCVWCGQTENLSLDHIVPVSKGGGDERSNLQTLCRSCNSRKHNKDDAIAKAEIMGEAA